jgi:hypothetical protein
LVNVEADLRLGYTKRKQEGYGGRAEMVKLLGFVPKLSKKPESFEE